MACNADLLSVTEFASQPFVQRALQSPHHPESVLSFFYGVDCFTKNKENDDNGEEKNSLQEKRKDLIYGTCIKRMGPLWYNGGAEYDKLCQPFAEAVRQAGKRTLPSPWNDTVDGCIAQIVLCDQLARNIFRGTPEAFAYDDTSQSIARRLTDAVLREETETKECEADSTLSGEFYPPYLSSMVLVFMHSEQRSDHELALQLIERARRKFSSFADDETIQQQLDKNWDDMRNFELQHKVVIDRFGRYPHRNKFKGRSNTPEEEAWLADRDNLPGWAKSH